MILKHSLTILETTEEHVIYSKYVVIFLIFFLSKRNVDFQVSIGKT